MGTPLNLHISLQKPHALLDRREAERVPVTGQVRYTAEEQFHGVSHGGTLRDLSKTGCQIVSHHPPTQRSRITLTLHLSDGQEPLCIVDAIVRQVRGSVLGVKFPRLTSEARRRLQALVLQRARRSEAIDKRTAFRIA